MSKEENNSLDAMDLRILALLQVDATTPVAEIANEVGLSQTPCWRLIRRMRELGSIMAEPSGRDRVVRLVCHLDIDDGHLDQLVDGFSIWLAGS